MTTKVQASLKVAAEDKSDDTAGKSVPTFEVDPRTLVIIPGFNSRPIDRAHVEYFKELRRAGVDTGHRIVQMIDGVRAVRDGHHRQTADMELIAEGVDIRRVKVLEFKGDEKAAIFLMLATQSGMKYTPLQLGEQYVKLENSFGMSYAEIAKERGCSVQNVKDAIRLAQQPAELKELIVSGEVTSSTALKLVKSTGSSGAALATVKAGIAAKPAAVTRSGKAKPLTQKVIDNLGKSVVTEAAKRTQVARDFVEAWLDSPSLPDAAKRVLTQMRDMCDGKMPVNAARDEKAERKLIADWLATHRSNQLPEVKLAATLLSDLFAGKKIPAGDSNEAIYYRHMVWLRNMADDSKDMAIRAAAKWFIAVIEAKRSGLPLVAAPSVLSLEDALRAEMDSGGAVMAETLCPEHAALIAWARGRA